MTGKHQLNRRDFLKGGIFTGLRHWAHPYSAGDRPGECH